MKYISLAIILLLMVGTWKLSAGVDPVSVKTHHELQTDLAKIIEAAVKAQLPDAKDFNFQKIYTETLNPSTVQAHFEYTFIEPADAQGSDTQPTESDASAREIEGTALLTRDPSNENLWILETVKVDQSTLEFQQGLTITVDGKQPL